MKQKFINFLKKNHALKEYEQIVTKEINNPTTLDEIIKTTPNECLLEHDWVFNHYKVFNGVNWEKLNEMWLGELEVCRNCIHVQDEVCTNADSEKCADFVEEFYTCNEFFMDAI